MKPRNAGKYDIFVGKSIFLIAVALVWCGFLLFLSFGYEKFAFLITQFKPAYVYFSDDLICVMNRQLTSFTLSLKYHRSRRSQILDRSALCPLLDEKFQVLPLFQKLITETYIIPFGFWQLTFLNILRQTELANMRLTSPTL